MIKTIGTAYKRDDFTHDEFFDYWMNVHAPISRQAPGLRGYVVTELLRKIGGELEVDGIVEQWYDDEEALDRATKSPEGQAAWADGANYAQTTCTFWVAKQHIIVPPPIG